MLTRQTQGHAANVVVLVLSRQGYGGRLIVLDLRQQPQGAGAHAGVLMLGQFQERGLGVVLALVQPIQAMYLTELFGFWIAAISPSMDLKSSLGNLRL